MCHVPVYLFIINHVLLVFPCQGIQTGLEQLSQYLPTGCASRTNPLTGPDLIPRVSIVSLYTAIQREKAVSIKYLFISKNDRLIILLLTNNLSISVKSQLPDC